VTGSAGCTRADFLPFTATLTDTATLLSGPVPLMSSFAARLVNGCSATEDAGLAFVSVPAKSGLALLRVLFEIVLIRFSGGPAYSK